METKDHLTKEGLEKIREISSKMNTGRTFREKYNFLSHSLNLDSNGTIQYKLPEYWVQTFIDGEGMFYNYLKTELPLTSLNHYPEEKIKVILNSSMEIAQANHDVLILIAIKQFFNGGYIKPKYNVSSITECQESRSVNRFILRDTKKIIEFVNKYPMLTKKHLDYLDWKTIVELKNNGEYKSPEGLAKIQEIKGRMNSCRLCFGA
jgi:LAGLIDADG endonuclease